MLYHLNSVLACKFLVVCKNSSFKIFKVSKLLRCGIILVESSHMVSGKDYTKRNKFNQKQERFGYIQQKPMKYAPTQG